MDQKKLRETFGMFTTGVIISCGSRKSLLGKILIENSFFKPNSTKNTEPSESNKTPDSKAKYPIFSRLKSKLNLNDNRKSFFQKFEKLLIKDFFGITINSFTSVSLNPALISFCIDNRSTNISFFRKNKYFVLNILSEQQQELASAFAKTSNIEKWKLEPYSLSQFGNPIFEKSLAYIECKKHRIIKMGDHQIMICKVMNFSKISESMPLIYFRGKYANLSL